MEDADLWIGEAKAEDFLIMVQKLHSRLYDFLEAKRSRGSKVTDPICGAARKVMEYMALRATKISEENVVLKTKLSEMERHDRTLEEIAQRISRSSVDGQAEASGDMDEQTGVRREDFFSSCVNDYTDTRSRSC